MNPFTLGVIAGEGCFKLDATVRNSRGGYVSVNPRMSILLTSEDIETLKCVQDELGGVGSITKTGDGHVALQCGSKEDLEKIVSKIKENSGDMWDKSLKSEQFGVWEEIVSIYADGRTTKQQKIEMLELAKEMPSGGRNRGTSLEEHIETIKGR